MCSIQREKEWLESPLFQLKSEIITKDLIHHIYGGLNTKLQHMVSFIKRDHIPGASGKFNFFNKKTFPREFFQF